jgi:hypothetical protein
MPGEAVLALVRLVGGFTLVGAGPSMLSFSYRQNPRSVRFGLLMSGFFTRFTHGGISPRKSLQSKSLQNHPVVFHQIPVSKTIKKNF